MIIMGNDDFVRSGGLFKYYGIIFGHLGN